MSLFKRISDFFRHRFKDNHTLKIANFFWDHSREKKELDKADPRMIHVRAGGLRIKGGNYCPIHNEYIEDHLVNTLRPDCIKKHNGCGNCPNVIVRTESTDLSDGRKSITDWRKYGGRK